MPNHISPSTARRGRLFPGGAAGGALFGLTAGLLWGGQFPVAKTVLPSLGPYYLTTVRYIVAALGFALILWFVEGRQAFRLDGRLRDVALLGATGFAGFNLLVFQGLVHSRPENAALIVASMPLLTALVLWARRGIRPSRATLVLLVVALLGAGLVISRGRLSFITSGQVGYGDLLVLLGALCWVIYTMGAASFTGWSPLRYTALTATAGGLTVLAITLIASVLGLIAVPSISAVTGAWWQIIYMSIPAGVVAVLSWNAGVRRLGPQNGVLFINLVPITTFTIEVVRGSTFTPIELIGAAITIGALLLNNLLSRKRAAPLAAMPRAVPVPTGALRATQSLNR